MPTSQFRRATTDDMAVNAEAACLWAERHAGVTIRELVEVRDLLEVSELLREIWGSTLETGPPLNRDTLRTLAHAGCYVAGAYDARGLRGALVGFLGDDDEGVHLHSHILGVRPRGVTGGTGFALKLHQRAWALRRGHDVIEWTFDPLVRRNAFFNLTKLGGNLHRYHVDFYGVMADKQNGDDDSDRVRLRWSLGSERVAAAAAGVPHIPQIDGDDGLPSVLLDMADDGGPVLRELDAHDDTLVLHLPADIVELRRRRPDLARKWRRALRQSLTAALAELYHCDGVTRDGAYVLRRHLPP